MAWIIIILIVIGYCFGLYLWFEKAGEKGWKAFVPYLRITTWVKLTGKSNSFIFWSFIPVVNLFIYSNLLGETSDSYKRYSFWEHFMAVALGFIWLPYLGKNEAEKYYGPQGSSDGVKPPEKAFYREWADALIFAIFAAYFIRTFIFEIYMIPTSSMEGTLRVDDFLVVSKFHYGSRIPNTPLAFPLVHHSFPAWIPIIGGKKAYSELIKLDYSRLPKLQSVERNDMVVFNFPANDTTTKEYDSMWPYYSIVRDAKKAGIENAEAYVKQEFTVFTRPVDKRENYIKRCVAIPGDVLKIESGKLIINGKDAYQPEHLQFRYMVITDGSELKQEDVLALDITEPYTLLVEERNAYEVYTTSWQAKQLAELSNVTSVELAFFNSPKLDFIDAGWDYYPHYPKLGLNWNIDNFGPITIPAKGMTINFVEDGSVKNFFMYRRCIEVYEGNKVEVKDKKIYINGTEATSYTFKMNYYWMMGDNRHKSQDSRFWGFVPEDHIVGKAWFLVTNLNMKNAFSFKRTFKSIHGNWAPKSEEYRN